MNSYHDYETMGYLNWALRHPEAFNICEAFSGTKIVKWSGNIERQLVNMLEEAEKGRNYPYADKLREFLKIWRANEITGSINRETLEILKSAADILAVDQWDMSAYFGSLKDQLRILIASEEQLPRGMEEPGNEPMAGGGGGAGDQYTAVPAGDRADLDGHGVWWGTGADGCAEDRGLVHGWADQYRRSDHPCVAV